MANIFLKSLPSELIFLGYHTPVSESIKLEYDTPVSQSSQGMSPYRKSLMTPGSTAISQNICRGTVTLKLTWIYIFKKNLADILIPKQILTEIKDIICPVSLWPRWPSSIDENIQRPKISQNFMRGKTLKNYRKHI